MGLFSALGFTKNKREKRADQMLDQGISDQGARRLNRDSEATSTRRSYLDLLEGFDPRQYMTDAAGAVTEDAVEGLTDTISDNNQGLNARGFFGSSLGTAKIAEGFSKRLSNALAGLSLQTAGLEQDRIGMIGGQAATDAGRADYARDTELDLLSGNVDRETARRNSRLKGTMGIVSGASKFARPGG